LTLILEKNHTTGRVAKPESTPDSPEKKQNQLAQLPEVEAR